MKVTCAITWLFSVLIVCVISEHNIACTLLFILLFNKTRSYQFLCCFKQTPLNWIIIFFVCTISSAILFQLVFTFSTSSKIFLGIFCAVYFNDVRFFLIQSPRFSRERLVAIKSYKSWIFAACILKTFSSIFCQDFLEISKKKENWFLHSVFCVLCIFCLKVCSEKLRKCLNITVH